MPHTAVLSEHNVIFIHINQQIRLIQYYFLDFWDCFILYFTKSNETSMRGKNYGRNHVCR